MYSDYECTEIVPVSDGYAIRAKCKKINFGKRDIIDYVDANKYNECDEEKDGMDLFFDKVNICQEIWDCFLSVDQQHNDKYYLANIVLSGINTCYEGLSERIRAGIIKLLSHIPDANVIASNVKVIASSEREHSAWIGGSILGSLSTFEAMWITRADYDEKGPSVVMKRVHF